MEKSKTTSINIKKVYHILIPLAFYLAVNFIFFIRLFYPQTSLFMIPDFGESDVLHFNLPLKTILSNSLKDKSFPLWTSKLAGGYPILAEGQIGTFYLPNLLLFRFLPLVTAYNLAIAFSFLLSSLGCYLSFKKLGFNRFSSFLSGIIFSYSGFFSVHLNHLNLLQTASLFPLIFWASVKLYQHPKLPHIILLAFLLSQQIFAGYVYVVFISVVGICSFWGLFTLINLRQTFKIRVKIFAFLFTFLLALTFSAIQLLPTVELWQKSLRSTGLDFETVTSYPYPPKHLLTFLSPYLFGDPKKGTYPQFDSNWGIFWENTAYLGLLPLFLALANLFLKFKKPNFKDKLVIPAFILLIISILLVLGKYSPLYFIFSFPPFNLFRVPSRFLLLTTFSLTLLVAGGLEKINYLLAGHKTKIVFFFMTALFIFADELRFSFFYPPLSAAVNWLTPPESANYFLNDKNNRIFSFGAPFVWNKIFLKYGWQDIAPYIYFNNSLYPNYNSVFSISSINLNTGGLPLSRQSKFSAMINDIVYEDESLTAKLSLLAKNSLSASSVTYLITPYKLADPQFRQDLEIIDENHHLPSFYIYHNQKAKPRYYLTSNYQLVTTLEQVKEEFSQADFLDHNLVLIEKIVTDFKPEKGEADVKLIEEKETSLLFKIQQSTTGFFVLTDTYYPGWQAEVDGKMGEIIPANLHGKAVFLEKGDHLVKFYYQPASFLLGKKITYIFLFIAFSILFLHCAFSSHKHLDNNQLFAGLFGKKMH